MKKKSFAFALFVLGLVLITTGTAYAIFRFTQVGTTESSMQVGSITFHYKEINGKGHGINISNAYPISDVDGKAQNDYFDFRITSNSAFAEIPYTISVVPAGDVELANVVKLYLTEVNNNVETQVVLSKYSELTSVTFTGKEEKVLYRTTVPVDGSSYEKNYRLRMWIDSEANFNGTNVTKYYCGDTEVAQGTVCDNGRVAVSKHVQASAYNNKSLSLTVNVHTNDGQTLTQDNVTTPDDTSIKMLTANNTYLFTESNDNDVDLEVNVPNNVDSINLNTTLTNMRAVESITPLGQTLSYVDVPIVTRLSLSDTYTLLTGDNYFKLRVRSADTTRTKDYILKITREQQHDNDLTYLEVANGSTIYSLTPTFNSSTTSYSVSVEESKITITATKSSDVASVTGNGEKTLDWGINNYTVRVTAEDGVPKDYNIEVNNVKPTAPTITGGTNGVESSLDQTITILSPGTAVSGVAYYEYYKSTSSTAPTDSTTGTQLSSPYNLIVGDSGTTYIWYRTVSNKGNKSVWSNVQEVNISSGSSTFADLILADNPTIKTNPTLTSATTTESGLYSMTTSNGFGGTGTTTYYFRGNVTNNVVEFAGQIWRVVRINEDGTVRLILDTYLADSARYGANTFNRPNDVYYSNNIDYIKNTLDTWYSNNITGTNATKVATGNYFCESAKVGAGTTSINGATVTNYSSYTPDLACNMDGKNKQYVNSSIGLLTYDELVLAGAYPVNNTAAESVVDYILANNTYYLAKGINGDNTDVWWTMSPSDYNGCGASVWRVTSNMSTAYNNSSEEKSNVVRIGVSCGMYYSKYTGNFNKVRPVINLKADVTATKNSSGHYVVQ